MSRSLAASRLLGVDLKPEYAEMGMEDETALILDAHDDDHGGDGALALAGVGFDPTEDELVLHYLRPQLRGFAPRVVGAVVEADPCGAAPWELVARHGRRDQGFFFAARGRRRPLVRRSVGGGAWLHSSTKNGRSVTELGVVVRWCRVTFCFYVRGGGGVAGGQRSTGWVMAEYEVTDPRCYRRADDGEEDDYWVLCHVRRSSRPATKLTTSSPGGQDARSRSRRKLAAEGRA